MVTVNPKSTEEEARKRRQERFREHLQEERQQSISPEVAEEERQRRIAESGGRGGGSQRETTDTGIEIFRGERGRISGFTDPRSGKTFFGGGDEAVRNLQEKLGEQIGGVPVQKLPGSQTPLEQIREDPEAFGLVPAEGEQPPEGIQSQEEPLSFTQQARQRAGDNAFFRAVNPAMARVLQTLGGDNFEFKEDGGVGIKEGRLKNVALNAALLGGASGLVGWAVKGLRGLRGAQTVVNARRAAQLGTAAKNTKTVRSIIPKLTVANVFATYGVIQAGKGLIETVTGKERVEEQQSAINTLGQITSTIVGDSTTSAGDWRAGLRELEFIKSEILRLESDIKQGKIREATLTVNGKVFDIDADVFDQLATVDEGIRDIRSFSLEGQFPDLEPFEIQAILRQLEDEGIIEPVDLTTSRRQTSK